jgi:alpha-tubulin suppressor-like RCC1 family protein
MGKVQSSKSKGKRKVMVIYIVLAAFEAFITLPGCNQYNTNGIASNKTPPGVPYHDGAGEETDIHVAHDDNTHAMPSDNDAKYNYKLDVDSSNAISLNNYKLELGMRHNCVVNTKGELFCWGCNQQGQLGNGITDKDTPEFQMIPFRIGTDSDWASVSGGYGHSCGIKKSGELYCWGGSLAKCFFDDEEIEKKREAEDWGSPPLRLGKESDWETISSGGFHVCGIRAGGRLFCLGNNEEGAIGDGTMKSKYSPVMIGSYLDWKAVVASKYHTCGITVNGDLYCWGYNKYGQIGDGTKKNRLSPVRVGKDFKWKYVARSGVHTCAIDTSGYLYCWGYNKWGQLGDGTNEDKLKPTRVGDDSDWESVTGGYYHTCAIKTNGELYCWGDNAFGRLGDGTRMGKNTPVRIGLDTDWISISAAEDYNCAVKKDGRLFCWGGNACKQFGLKTDPDGFLYAASQLVPLFIMQL